MARSAGARARRLTDMPGKGDRLPGEALAGGCCSGCGTAGGGGCCWCAEPRVEKLKPPRPRKDACMLPGSARTGVAGSIAGMGSCCAAAAVAAAA